MLSTAGERAPVIFNCQAVFKHKAEVPYRPCESISVIFNGKQCET